MYRKSRPEMIEEMIQANSFPPFIFGLTLLEAMEIDLRAFGGKHIDFYNTLYLDDPLRLHRVFEP